MPGITAAFAGQYVLGLLAVALMLFGLHSAVRRFVRSRLIASSDRRFVTVIESTLLAQNTTLHVVRVADRHYLLGGGNGQVRLLAEICAEDAARIKSS